MLRRKTVFVIGAGAGVSVGMPIGRELADSISEQVCFATDEWGRFRGGHRTLLQAAQMPPPHGKPPAKKATIDAGQSLTAALPHARSIDSFIASRADDENREAIEYIGKIAILLNILAKEEGSKMAGKFHPHLGPQLNPAGVADTWFNQLFQILQTGVGSAAYASVLNNASFIVFNYDRCLEFFLFHAIQNYFGVGPTEAGRVVSKARIYHPYGIAGGLPYIGDQPYLSFGEQPDAIKLNAASAMIQTYGDAKVDQEVQRGIQDALRDAEVIVFLGFGFHEENLEILRFPSAKNPMIYSTDVKLPQTAVSRFKGQLLETFKRFDEQPIVNWRFGGIGDCEALFRDYGVEF
ncbi:MAG: hypothetical protein ACE363_06630 [Alphaproteobacteria bacterium]